MHFRTVYRAPSTLKHALKIRRSATGYNQQTPDYHHQNIVEDTGVCLATFSHLKSGSCVACYSATTTPVVSGGGGAESPDVHVVSGANLRHLKQQTPWKRKTSEHANYDVEAWHGSCLRLDYFRSKTFPRVLRKMKGPTFILKSNF